ncbi:MAG: hypothetical protein K6B68_03775 [Eubacterium sp.]|nr:hypothetical protein [Eubacterium sp.]
MRGNEVRYALEHAKPDLAQAIWNELMTPKSSMDKIREAKARELERRAIKARERYEKSLQTTPYFDSAKLRGVQIDYQGLIAYARNKGITVPELTDEEKNKFIINSTMSEIKKMCDEAGL